MGTPKFKVGDVVYRATYKKRQVEVVCPICYGKLEVKLILGNGDSVKLLCDYCGKGSEGPKGYIYEYNHSPSAQRFPITGVRVETTGEKETIEYLSGNSCSYQIVKESECYVTEEEALVAAVAIKRRMDKEQSARAKYIKKDVSKTYSWNAGYHMRSAKNNRRQAEYHERKAILCKAKTKKQED